MVLTDEDRGALERAIDTAKSLHVPAWLQYFRDEDNKKHMQYQHAEDVVFGVAWGFVLASFLPTLMPKLQLGMLTQDDLNQVMKILHDRGDEIRDAIHKLG